MVDIRIKPTKIAGKYRNCTAPVDARRRFNVDTTSYDVVRCHIDVETTSCVYRGVKSVQIRSFFLVPMFPYLS